MKKSLNKINIHSALVTGADGFIGSNLVDHLVSHNIYVKCLVYYKDQLRWLSNRSEKIEIVTGDILELNSLYKIVQGVDVVFHLAGIVKSLKKKDFFDINVKGTENLLKVAVNNNPDLKRFFFMSSQAASGPSSNGVCVNEKHKCCPVTMYGRSKRDAEKIVLSYSDKIPVTIIRPSTVYGPRDKELFFIFDIVNKGIMPVIGLRERFFNFCYIDDLIKATILAAVHEKSIGQIYFIHSDQKLSINQFIQAIVHGLNRKVVKLPIPLFLLKLYFLFNEFSAVMRKDDKIFTRDKYNELKQYNWICSIEKAEEEIGYRPDFILAQGISNSIEWYKGQDWLL
ncbi:MAG: NAD-dependent epimerase/dehydratase family protein [bacterium]